MDEIEDYKRRQRAIFPGLDAEFDRGVRRILSGELELECMPNVPYSPNHQKLADQRISRGPVIFLFGSVSLAGVINALTIGSRELEHFSLEDVGYVTPSEGKPLYNGKPIDGDIITETMKIVYAKMKK